MDTKSLGLNNLVTFIKYLLIVILISSILNVVFKVIENKFGVNEYANTLDYGNYSSESHDSYFSLAENTGDAHFALTLIIVLAPTCLLFGWLRNRIIKASNDKTGSYMTPLSKIINWVFVFASSFSLISTFISSVYILINNKQTIAGQLEVLTIVLISISVLYYSTSVIKYDFENSKAILARKLSLIFMIVGILLAIILGFIYTNPKDALKLQADKERISLLSKNMGTVNRYLNQIGYLPKDRNELGKYYDYDKHIFSEKDADGGDLDYKFLYSNLIFATGLDKACFENKNNNNNQNNSPYYPDYNCNKKVWSGNAEYQLCATFEAEAVSSKNTKDSDKSTNIFNWNYKEGYDCYNVKLEAEKLNQLNYDLTSPTIRVIQNPPFN